MSEEQIRRQQIDRALKSLAAAKSPKGMEDRLVQRLHALQVQAGHQPKSRQRYIVAAWMAAAAVCLLTAGLGLARRAAVVSTHEAPPAALKQPGENDTLLARTSTQQVIQPEWASIRKPASVHTVRRAPQHEAQSAPPLPLTSQERMLIAMAESPRTGAGVAVSETVANHGLGENALFELDHDALPAPPASTLETNSLPSSFSSSNFPGGNQ